MDIDLKQLRELMRALKQFDLQELVVEKGDEKIKLVRSSGGALGAGLGASMAPGALAGPSLVPPALQALPPAPAASSRPADAEAAADDASVTYITSPFVGTFYRAPSPDAAPFVEVGSVIRPGQTLCIVEAMKLMNEIEAEIAGTILEVVAENGKPVEYGDRLFKVKKG
jgi:acetyl-CoA carboxylase biotin carboxyl carrier protein